MTAKDLTEAFRKALVDVFQEYRQQRNLEKLDLDKRMTRLETLVDELRRTNGGRAPARA